MTPEVMNTIERRTHQGNNSELEKEFLANLFRQIDIMDLETSMDEANMDYYRQNVVLAVNSLLLYIQRVNKESSQQGKEHIGESKEKLFYEFRALLTQKFREDRSVQFYADTLKVSTRHLNAICQRASGQNAKEIIDHYTIIELQVALMYTHKSFQELVSDFKFPDQSYLNRYFKRHTGYSLSEFRANGVMVD
jgi:AraC-like DNA-binding protein